MPVGNQAENEQNGVHDDIERSEGNGDQLIKTAHQRLEGIDAQCGELKNTDGDGTDDDAAERHGKSSFLQGLTFIPGIFVHLSILRKKRHCKR